MSSSQTSDRDDALIDAAMRQFAAARDAARPVSGVQLDARDGKSSVAEPLGRDSLVGYELLGERHRGGQGVVFEALQRATKRKVAIKVLYDSPEIRGASRRRFEREIDILTQLRHPNIVTVHDRGAAAGRFFYVMDLVSGVPLDRWIESQRTDRMQKAVASGNRGVVREEIADILELFAKICDAVNAAHLRGVIHRDLKPGNILIDGAGEPHVLDFGLAKFASELAGEATVAAAVTETGQFVGSMPWASPEQVTASPEELDTRSDVYSLGVLLYQAITAQFPYRVVGGVADVIDQIRNVEPRPMNEARTQPSDGRSLGMPARVDDEVETIVLKCLQKDRARRYQTAGDLGRDIRRYLNHEPIEAKRDSFGYLLRKQLRRHRLIVTAAAAVLLAVVGGLIASLSYWRQAEERRVLAEKESERARAAETKANTKTEEADAVAKLLEQMFGSSDAYEFPGPDATIREVITKYSDAIFDNLEDKPEIEMRMRKTLGMAFYNLAEFDKAGQSFSRGLEIARRQLGPQNVRVSEALSNLAAVRLALGDNDGAMAAYQEALTIDEQTRDDPNCLEPDTLFNIGQMHMFAGRTDEARSFFDRSLERFKSVPEDRQSGRIAVLRSMARIVGRLEGPAKAVPMMEEVLVEARKAHGEHDTRTAAAYADLGSLLYQAGRAAEAVSHAERAIAIDRERLGNRHPILATRLANYGIILKSLGQLDAAEPAMVESLEIRRAVLPPDHRDVAFGIEGIASIKDARKLYAEAEPYFIEAAEIFEKQGKLDADALRNRSNIGRMRFLREDYAGAVQAYAGVLETRLTELPAEHPDVQASKLRLATSLLKNKQYAEAEPMLRECWENKKKEEAQTSWSTLNTQSMLGEALFGLQRHAEAEPMLLESFEGLKTAKDTPRDKLSDAAKRLVEFYSARSDEAAAERWRSTLSEVGT